MWASWGKKIPKVPGVDVVRKHGAEYTTRMRSDSSKYVISITPGDHMTSIVREKEALRFWQEQQRYYESDNNRATPDANYAFVFDDYDAAEKIAESLRKHPIYSTHQIKVIPYG